MIPRYSRKEMSDIWEDHSRFSVWLEVETLALEQMVKEGLAPEESVKDMREKGEFSVERVLEIEAEVKHDVIAFLTNVAEHVGENSRFVHRGMTSSDLLDTSFAVQLKRSGEMILKGVDDLMAAVLKRAEEHRYTGCVGRSHGIHAEPITFGLKVLSWYAELGRARRRIEAALEEVKVGKIAGPVGTYASVSPDVEKHVMDSLGLQPEDVPTQIVHRDRHAAFFTSLALLASSIERFSVEIRHLQRTEVGEVHEKFSSKQKGSSAMPHKKNPILTENLTGLARLVRSYSLAAMENIALWHERDISHSSVERIIAPDCCTLVDFMLKRFNSVVSGMVVSEEQMQKNLDLTRGLVFSGSLLIALVDNGVLREDAYRIVQKHALEAWEGRATFQERVKGDKELAEKVSASMLDEVFDLQRHFQHVDMIFERTIKNYS